MLWQRIMPDRWRAAASEVASTVPTTPSAKEAFPKGMHKFLKPVHSMPLEKALEGANVLEGLAKIRRAKSSAEKSDLEPDG